MSFTIDSNILVYGQQPHSDRYAVARTIVDAMPGSDVILTVQALGEFLKVVRLKVPGALSLAVDEVRLWSLLFPCVHTEPADLLTAAELAERHKLQFWDSLILTVAAGAGATTLLSEDMQDGAVYNGVRVVDPFNLTNRTILDTLLTPAP